MRIFAHPQILWLELVIPPAMIAFFWWSLRKRQQLITQFIQSRLLQSLTQGVSPARQKFRLACLVLAVVFVILALARPQWGSEWQETRLRGLDIVVAIDTSKSMLAEDIPPNRLERAKLAALELMQLAKSDRLGLVAFAGSAFLQCPLTIDDAIFRQNVQALDVNTIPQGGTALAEAIAAALTAFKEGDGHKAMVLFTDGEDHDSGALAAAKKAADAGMQIFTIGIGSAEGELLRVKDAKGRTDYVRDEQGNVVKSHLNEQLLQEIAGATEKGFYLPLRGAKTIETLYAQGLSPLPKSDSQERRAVSHEQFHWPLSLAIILLLLEMFFPERKWEPASSAPSFARARAGLQETMAILLLVLLPAGALASPSSALREYKAGQYDKSLKEYEKLLERNSDDPRLHFNAGTAAYRNHQFEEAAKQFDQALASQDLKVQEQTYYNRGNTLYYLGETNPDPAKRMETWKKSLEDFQNALTLNRPLKQSDPDAQFNYDFVKKRLEELQQQQQKQPEQKTSDQKQDQEQKQNQPSQQNQQGEQSKKEQEKQSPDQQNQPSGQKQDQNQQARQQKDQEKNQQAANQPNEKKEKSQPDQRQANRSQPKDSSGEQDTGEPGQTYAAGQMTPEQARQLLDAQKGEEQPFPVKPPQKPVDGSRPIRDW